MTQCYKIANLIVEMSAFGKTLEQAAPYLCEAAQPDIRIPSDYLLLKEKQPHLSDDSCAYLCTGNSFYSQLLHFDGMMLHASAVVADGCAYLFSAPCGTGKSTHAQLWLREFGDRAYILNDDKPALRCEDGIWYAYGTPWSGKTDLNVNARAPVAGICFLHQAQENRIERFFGADAIFAMLQQTVRPSGETLRSLLMEQMDKLMSAVPVWKMGCNMELEAAKVAFAAMSAERKDC